MGVSIKKQQIEQARPMMMEYISNFRRRYHHELSNRMEIDRGASMPGNLADVKLVRCCTKLVAITVPIYAITVLEYPPFVLGCV